MKPDTLLTHSESISIQDAIEDFILHQRACRNSPATIIHYKETLVKMQGWMEAHGLSSVESICAASIRQWLAEMSDSMTRRGTKVKPGTVWTAYKNARAFFNFQEAEEVIKSNPMKRIRAPKRDMELLPAFTTDEIKKLEAITAGKDSRSIRNRALIYLLLDSGCRLAEVANLSVKDVNLQTGAVMVRKGKGGKDRMTRVGATALRAISKYLRIRNGKPEDPIWVGQYGPLTAPGIRIILERMGKSCGVHCHAHKFRRTTALSMLRNGCDVYSIKSLLGHSDLQVLQRYLAQTEADISVAHERFGPLDHLN